MSFPESVKLPSGETVKTLFLLAIWTFSGAILAFCSTVLSVAYKDWLHNEITDWKYAIDLGFTVAKPLGLVAAAAYRQKYMALIAAPPGTGIKKQTRSKIEQPGRPPITATTTEEIKIVPKPAGPQPEE